MLKHNKNLFVIVPFILALIFIYKVNAESTDNNLLKKRIPENTRDYVENKFDKMPGVDPEKLKEKRCELISKRIDDKLENFNNNHFKHKNLHINIREKLVRIITLAKEKNLDVSKLEEDLVTLDAKIKVFNDTYLAYIDKLKLTKESICGNSEEDFIKKVVSAGQELKSIKGASLDIKEFVQNTLKQDIKNLRSQVTKTED